MGEKVINAALLGLGTVGTGVYKVLKNQEEEMTAKLGCKVKIRKILVRNLKKPVGPCDGCPYGRNNPCIGFCMKKLLGQKS